MARVRDIHHLDPLGPPRLQPVTVLGRSDPVVGALHDEHRHRSAGEPAVGRLGPCRRHLGASRSDGATGVDECRIHVVPGSEQCPASAIEPFGIAERLVEELGQGSSGLGVGRYLATGADENHGSHQIRSSRREEASHPVPEGVADDDRRPAEELDDLCDVIRMFYDALGGARFYPRQPPVVKEIVLGLKRSLILKRYPTMTHLRQHLESMRW